MRGKEIAQYLDRIAAALQYMADSGCSGFEVSPEKLNIFKNWGKGAPIVLRETLHDIRADLGDCRRCSLHSKRRHIVFGEGNPEAQLVFVGEGPGADEDLQGRPFVGAAGQLLTRIIEAMGLSRADVYICNVVKCRPPGNRNPLPDEIDACAPFLSRQLAVIKPVYICALGKFAAQYLLKTTAPISAIRGRFFDHLGIPVMPTYHPAFLLRSPEKKKEVWEDIQMIMKGLGLQRAKK